MRLFWHKFRKSSERVADGLTETQRDALRGIVVLLVVAVVGSAGYFVGWPLWRRWQNRRALAQAAVFAHRRDYRSLVLVLRRATQLAPNAVTWKKTALFLDEINSPEALLAREQLVQLAPQDTALRLTLAQDAMKFGRFDVAESALAGVDAKGRQDAAFHRTAASLAAALGRSADLEKETKAVLAADPGDPDARFAYAALRLWGADPEGRAAARVELEKLLMEPSVRVRAAIELLSEASRQGTPGQVVDVLNLLLAGFAPQAVPDFSSPTVPAWAALLDGIKAAAASRPADVALVARWLAAMDRWPDARSWLESLPPAIRTADAVTDIDAQLSAENGDFARLSRLLQNGAWGNWPSEAQTLAIASRLEILHFDKERGRQMWGDAIAADSGSIAGLRALSRLASIWGDRDGEAQVLQDALRHDPKAFWAYDALRSLYLTQDDLPHLWELYGAWSAQLPDDASVAAARIMLGCVLNCAGANAVGTAGQLRTRFPGSLSAQVAYAAALWRGGRGGAAWQVLAALPPAAQERQDVSFWAALIQADLGHSAEAVALLRRVLPSVTGATERALLQAAAAKVGYSP